MKRAGGGFDPSYNGQTAVDDTAHIIVAAELGNNASDTGKLLPMLKAVAANLGQEPEQVLADAGYRSEAVFAQLARSGIDAVIALGHEGKRCAEIYPETRASALLSYWRGRPERSTSNTANSTPPRKYAARVRHTAVRPMPSTAMMWDAGMPRSRHDRTCARLTSRV
jgi:hypothetical protein